jgi:hypothetical protein
MKLDALIVGRQIRYEGFLRYHELIGFVEILRQVWESVENCPTTDPNIYKNSVMQKIKRKLLHLLE